MHGRLGFAVNSHKQTDVWVLEEGQRWILRYKLDQCVPRPYFACAAEGILAVRAGSSFYMHWWKRTSGSSFSRLRHDMVRVVHQKDKATPFFADMGLSHNDYQAFSYVETTEPLNVYAIN